MTRGREPVLICDGKDGDYCEAWSLDFYEQGASTVGGVLVTSTERSPGWLSMPDTDQCPACRPTPTEIRP